jgi:hypothetical protein
LNATLAKSGKPPVKIVDAAEPLEDDDIPEMVNAGLIPATIVDHYVAEFWSKIFDPDPGQPAAIRSDGEIAWARRNTAAAAPGGQRLCRRQWQGIAPAFNTVYQKYFKNTKWVTNAARNSK